MFRDRRSANVRATSTRSRRAISLLEIMIGVAIFGVSFIPFASLLMKQTKVAHETTYQVTAEMIGKSILDQIIKTVKFDRVTEKDLVVDVKGGADVELKLDAAMYKRVEVLARQSPGEIQLDECTVKWEIKVYDINATDLKSSFWRSERGKSHSDTDMKADPDTLALKVEVKNLESNEFSKIKKQTILKTIKLRMSWKPLRENEFRKQDRLVIVTRKARLEDISAVK